MSLEVPASRYRMSEHSFSETLSPVEHAPDVKVRCASTKGLINFTARAIRLSQAFGNEPAISMDRIPEETSPTFLRQFEADVSVTPAHCRPAVTRGLVLDSAKSR